MPGSTWGTDKIEPDLEGSFVTDASGSKSVCFKFGIGEDFGDVQDNDFDTYFAIDAGTGNFTSGWRNQPRSVCGATGRYAISICPHGSLPE